MMEERTEANLLYPHAIVCAIVVVFIAMMDERTEANPIVPLCHSLRNSRCIQSDDGGTDGG